MAWTCPRCDRRFGRRNQSHQCAPAMSLDAYFDARPPGDRAIFDAVRAILPREAHAEAVRVGILFKRARTFAELRPRRRGMELTVLLSRVEEGAPVRRTVRLSARRAAHFIDLPEAAAVDPAVEGLLLEAFDASPP